MALPWVDETDRAVTMFVVVPLHHSVVTHVRAAARFSNGRHGYSGRYLEVAAEIAMGALFATQASWPRRQPMGRDCSDNTT